jgi:hypothetical protein
VHKSRPFNHEDPLLELGGVQVQMVLAEVFRIVSLQLILFFWGLNFLFGHLSLLFLILGWITVEI